MFGDFRPSSKITVEKATYGVPSDPARTRDVTARVRRRVGRGEFSFRVNSMADGSDPAPGVTKTLTVNFTVGGEPRTSSATDIEGIVLCGESTPRNADVRLDKDGQPYLEVNKSGSYKLTAASGKTTDMNVAAPLDPVDVSGPWEVRFPAGWARRKKSPLTN